MAAATAASTANSSRHRRAIVRLGRFRVRVRMRSNVPRGLARRFILLSDAFPPSRAVTWRLNRPCRLQARATPKKRTHERHAQSRREGELRARPLLVRSLLQKLAAMCLL